MRAPAFAHVLACGLVLTACSSAATDAHPDAQVTPVAGSGSAGFAGSAGVGAAGTGAGGTASAGDAATADASASDAALADAGANGEPFTTPIGEWTFVPIEGMRCADGSPTGVGLRRSASSANLLFLFEGGGACWDASTCFDLDTAVHIESGYDAARFAEFSSTQGPVDPSSANPLETANAVFVPYCTGDLHAGDAVRSYTTSSGAREVHHVGRANVRAILSRLQTGLPAPSTVWIMGSSAGGYGAILNTLPIAQAYPDAQAHVLADCSPFVSPQAGRYALWNSAWDLQLPEGCSECATDFSKVAEHVVQDDTTRRFALLAYAQDATIAAYFGFDGSGLETAQNAMFDRVCAGPNARYFVVAGSSHVLMGQPGTTMAGNGVTLGDFTLAWLLGLPSFQNAR